MKGNQVKSLFLGIFQLFLLDTYKTTNQYSNKMKKSLILTLLFISTCLSRVYAQTELENLVVKKFDTWGVGFHVSANNPNGDATDGKSMFNIMSPKFGYGITVSKQFSHFLGFELDYSTGTLGTDYSPYKFKSSFNQYTGRVRLNFTNGQILANYDKTQLYAFAGVGMMNYKSSSEILNDGISSDWVHVIPFGVGYKRKLGSSTSINFELGYNRVNSDRLDAIKIAGTEKDGYTNLRVGLQYTLGKKKKPLEWDEALSYFKPIAEHSVDTIVIVKKEVSQQQDTAKKTVKSMTIWYDTGDYLINGIYSQDIYAILNQLKQNSDSWIEILAYCDSTGSEKTNNKLILKRSRMVHDFFVNEGIFQDRIKVYNYGMEFADSEILSMDRKVVIKYWKSTFDK